ncbi:hypothetical protein O6H91_16G080300 [Diphasiastrum complanatum]|uniref:Uncharacterized protein n=1 Tax=Diphasiastrum complanatum TaxID=34168 RepID=A0ACC2BDY7_DIPCM|nr:hypothetical protein O6H91_16G080300 [Diphasiastrum complanatum]
MAMTMAMDWRYLPEDVLSLVLVRLPLASQARLRCVCKQWRSILRSRELQQLRSLIVPSQRPWFVFLASNGSPSNWLEAYDPADEQWHKLALKLGESSRMRILVASAGGMICFATVNRRIFRGSTVWISNPFTGFKKTLPCPPSRFFSNDTDDAEDLRERFQALVMNPTTGGFKLLVEGYYRTLDVYDSASNTWTTTEMDLPSCVDFSISRPFCKGVLYCLARSPTRVVTYDVTTDMWNDHLALISSSIHSPCLIEHRGEVLLVGALARSGQDAEAGKVWGISIWMLMRSLKNPWEEVASMPPALLNAYLERSHGNLLYFVGKGDLVYFASVPSSSKKSISESLVYDLVIQKWYWVPECLMNFKHCMQRGSCVSQPVLRSAFGLPNMLACEAKVVNDDDDDGGGL